MSSDIDPQRLWLRVLYMGLIDAHECMHDSNIFKDTDDLDWLTSVDFDEVCTCVGRNPVDVRRLAYDGEVIARLKVQMGWMSKRDSEHESRAYTIARESDALQMSLF